MNLPGEFGALITVYFTNINKNDLINLIIKTEMNRENQERDNAERRERERERERQILRKQQDKDYQNKFEYEGREDNIKVASKFPREEDRNEEDNSPGRREEQNRRR